MTKFAKVEQSAEVDAPTVATIGPSGSEQPRRHRLLAMPEDDMCKHHPRCPDALAPDRAAARVSISRPEQGWSLLCNGVVLFDDAGTLLPGRSGRAGLPGQDASAAAPLLVVA
jgi:hypothetical protein